MLQVLIPQDMVARRFGQGSGVGHPDAHARGIVSSGGPMVTSWSLFGMQRIVAWEAPFIDWHFVMVRVVSSFAFS